MKSSEPESSSPQGNEDNLQPVFSKWREFNVNDDEAGKNNAENTESDEEDTLGLFRMFEPEDEDVYEDVTYEYGDSKSPVIIRHHGAYPNSTGLAVWLGAEILARFLVDAQTKEEGIGIASVQGKRVLEVGAGAGLPSIVAHKVLGASRVLVTDGDFDALNNLRYNVDQNRVDASISCLQLIWGKDIPEFLKAHGKQDIVLMADCVYMPPSLKPLWETIDALLEEDGIVVYAQTAASAVPWALFKEALERHEFETICILDGKEGIRKYNVDNGDIDDEKEDLSKKQEEEYESGIFVFRRKQANDE